MTRVAMMGLRKVPVRPDEWEAKMHPAVGLLKLLLDNDAASVCGDGMLIQHEIVACMSQIEREILGLPSRCPYSMHLEPRGAISDLVFRIDCSWLDKHGDPQPGLKRTGVILASPSERFLVSEPLFSLIEEVDALNGITSNGSASLIDARMKQFGRVKLALTNATGDAHADPYLEKLTIHYATGLSIEQSAGVNGPFEPVLFGDSPDPLSSGDHEEIDIEKRPRSPRLLQSSSAIST
jgi:hypothetical protein